MTLGSSFSIHPSVSILIPAFNEEKNIEGVLDQVTQFVESTAFPCEVVVIDDGSTDNTRKLACRHKSVVLHHELNRGKGAALKLGFRHSTGDIIVTMDADGSHEPADINRLIAPILNGADVVLGNRFTSSKGKASTTKLNLFGNSLINALILIMTGKRIKDSQTGFRALTRQVINEIEITSSRYQIETELTIKALRNGNIVREIPLWGTKKRINGISRVNPFRTGMLILMAILRASLSK